MSRFDSLDFMKATVSEHRTTSLAACASTVPLLREAGLHEVAAQLEAISSLARAGDDEAAFAMARKLPQSDIARIWDPFVDWEWREGDLTFERRALVTVYYWATWRSLVNWRVAKCYDFDRAAVDLRPDSLEVAAKELLIKRKERLDPDSWPVT